jgi:hypothetical protein
MEFKIVQIKGQAFSKGEIIIKMQGGNLRILLPRTTVPEEHIFT